ncbi:Protein RIK [Zostera marina]|uniref:Protein RIK n=1 Tax=Zostera marina TaxID=29655 RepID=A0A0K9NRI4_ZOSMR|nr:Protein RIK [Zostera marina]
MTTDNSSLPKVSGVSTSAEDSCVAKQRKKRKWDQPAESFIASGVLVPVTLPLGGNIIGETPKSQHELIAREIVINDAEPTVRYRLTKRQTQEEIQRSTGAVVITRGKYRPSNDLMTDNEKPLYLHISAGAHLKDTIERVKAVDHAASIVDGILKQGQHATLNTGLTAQILSTCIFLGFEPDASLNIADRIRGPNDRYINHIINVTGASVVLRGKGLECSGTIVSDEQPFHLYLSSNNARSLEEARILAENLLSTVSAECGTSRMSCSGVYATVPPPQQLLAGTRSWNSATEVNRNMTPAINSSLVSAGTNYSGYGGIYPQATPLQQVALALRHAPAFHTIPTSHALATTTPSQVTNLDEKIKLCSSEKDTRQRRKFKERAMVPDGTSPAYQNIKSDASLSNLDARKTSLMPPPIKSIQSATATMPPPPPPPRLMDPPPRVPSRPLTPFLPVPPRSMAPPPPVPPRSLTPPPPMFKDTNSVPKKQSVEPLPDPLLKLMEYGDEDEEEMDESLSKKIDPAKEVSTTKPFWAI